MTPNAEAAFLVAEIARSLNGRKHIAVGANLPIPTAAALLARQQSGGLMRVDILGSRNFDPLPGLGGLHDFACQGRYDGFFLSPGQIDGAGNINLVGVGNYPQLDVRWPGSHGAPLLYMMVPNVILFREVHRKRIFVSKVAFISAPGVSPPGVFRPGGPSALITNLGSFSFDRERARFRLESIHPPHTLSEIEAETGFAFDRAAKLGTTAPLDLETLNLIAGPVAREVAEIYPQFAKSLVESDSSQRAFLSSASDIEE